MNNIDQMIEVLEAAKRGEAIEMRKIGSAIWIDVEDPNWNWSDWTYQVKAPKKMNLVEELRGNGTNDLFGLLKRAADRIEELEEQNAALNKKVTESVHQWIAAKPLYCYDTDELLAEIARRIGK